MGVLRGEAWGHVAPVASRAAPWGFLRFLVLCLGIKGQGNPEALAKSSPGAQSYPRPSVCLVSLESQKDENALNEAQEIFTEMMKVVEQRDKLVDSLEEQRLKEKAEDQHFESFVFPRGSQLSRT